MDLRRITWFVDTAEWPGDEVTVVGSERLGPVLVGDHFVEVVHPELDGGYRAELVVVDVRPGELRLRTNMPVQLRRHDILCGEMED